jgi:hypothetical protein
MVIIMDASTGERIEGETEFFQPAPTPSRLPQLELGLRLEPVIPAYPKRDRFLGAPPFFAD